MPKGFIRTDEITGLWTYLASIDWSEPWFMGLLAFHTACVTATYLSRNHLTVQGLVFAAFLLMVGCSEYINKLAASHWRSFAREQYFDSNGLFISIVFSMPILFNCLAIVVFWLKTSADLMRGIRIKQVQQKARQQEQTTEAEGVNNKGDPSGSKTESPQRVTSSKSGKTD